MKMPPPSARQRYNANKAATSLVTKKPPKKLYDNKPVKEKKRKGEPKDVTQVDWTTSMMPSMATAFKTFVSVRFCSAIWSYISDCDETFNYWEPLHYIINGIGLQTWEYSPKYALRSYTYLLVQGVPGWVYQKLVNPTPAAIFYMIRCMLAFGCAVMERYMYKAICQEFGMHIGRLWLFFQLFSVGMFISSTALLPSSFSMYFGCTALAAWWQQNYNLAVFLTAISALLGWPFAALIGVPIAIDMLWRKQMWRSFIIWVAISLATIVIPMMLIDSTYFGKLTFAPLNIVIYNVFSSHGPNLYGTEPWSYYLVNGFLNFNVIWLLAIITPLMLLIDHFVVPAKSKATLNYPHYLSLAPFYLWILVFVIQPHKEERFLFPIYPLISLCGAVSVDIFQRIFFRVKSLAMKIKSGAHYLDHSMFIPMLVLVISTLLGLSRCFSLYRNYYAPIDIMSGLKEFRDSPQYRSNEVYNVCIGKDWYRYPSSFFMPANNFRIRFLKSEFRGMLPVYYADGPNATKIEQPYFNDMNQEDERTYFNYDKCQFLIDFDQGKYTELEPNYAKLNKEWTIIKSLPFLISEQSHQFYRAFYVPFLTELHTTYGDLNLFKRNKLRLASVDS